MHKVHHGATVVRENHEICWKIVFSKELGHQNQQIRFADANRPPNAPPGGRPPALKAAASVAAIAVCIFWKKPAPFDISMLGALRCWFCWCGCWCYWRCCCYCGCCRCRGSMQFFYLYLSEIVARRGFGVWSRVWFWDHRFKFVSILRSELFAPSTCESRLLRRARFMLCVVVFVFLICCFFWFRCLIFC